MHMVRNVVSARFIAWVMVAAAAAQAAWAEQSGGLALSSAGDNGVSQVAASTFAAGEENPPDVDSDWRFQFDTWIWLMGIEGDVTSGPISASVDSDFGDILDASDSLLAFSGRIEVGYKRLAGFVDGIYADIGADDRSGSGGLADIDVTMEMGIVDFGLMYRVFDMPTDHPLNTTIDLYAGARYIAVEVELDPAMVASVSNDEDWIDPIVGAKLQLPLAKRWHLGLWGDVGGFGASSDFTWSATGVLGFSFELFKLPTTLYGGYRAMGWDYSTGSGSSAFEWDVILHGPLMGLEMRF